MTELATIPDAVDATRACVLCSLLRPKFKAHQYDQAQACEDCRGYLRETVAEIPESYALLPDSLERGASMFQRVSGGEVEAALPFREDVWDLMQPIRYPPIRDFLADQVGYISAATVLDGWVRDWCDLRGRGESGPMSDVTSMVGWMLPRIEWACDEHPAVDEYASEMRTLAGALHRLVGTNRVRPQPCIGVPCRRCDLTTLARLSDGTGDVECQNPTCRTIYWADEYARWTRLLAAAAKRTA